MLFIDDSAIAQINVIREKDSLTPQHFVRVGVTSGGCSGLTYNMEFDDILTDEDQVFEDNGEKIVTDLKSFIYLANTKLVFQGGLDGAGFTFENPNAARTCACGESFAL
ncbi:MAG: HesB/IscA family protein [Saprospiraceae bacterium]